MTLRCSRVCAFVSTFTLIAAAQLHAQQDSPEMTRALERAERFDAALGPQPQPVALWLPDNRLAFSAAGSAPWSVLDPATGNVLQASANVTPPPPPPPSPLNRGFGPFNSERRWTASASDGNLVVSNSSGTQLTRQGAPDYGWVTYGDMSWNADGSLLYASRIDERNVHRIPIVDYSTAIERVTYATYPKTGTPLPVEELYIVDPAANAVRAVPIDTRDAYVWFIGWRPTVSEALVMRMSRDGKRLELYAIDAQGKPRVLARDERPETFVAALDFSTADWVWQVTPLPDQSGFLWMSERDGWRHVYLYGYDGVLKKQITSGAFPVHRILRVDSASRQIYVLASADQARPYDRHVYRVGFDGRGFTALTTTPGQHDALCSPSGDYFIDLYSSLTQPNTVELRRADGTLVKRLGQASTAPLDAVGYKPPEPFRVKASDGMTDLYGVIYKPADFDASKTYPIIDYIYAGPFVWVHQETFKPSQAMHRIAASLAQMGFVVAMVDARGTPARGKAFQDANYGRIGQIEIPDHVAALKAAARTRPWMDTTRVGIVGHSWGGYFALRGMLQAPDFYTVGYAGAPGDLTEAASINEPNMGLIENNRAGYEAGSNFALASSLRGKLKIMHGTSDTNASLSTTMRMTQALIAAGRQVDLLIMPGQGHGPAGAQGKYYREDIRRYMATWLPGPWLPGPGFRNSVR